MAAFEPLGETMSAPVWDSFSDGRKRAELVKAREWLESVGPDGLGDSAGAVWLRLAIAELDHRDAILRSLAAIDPYISGSNSPYECMCCTYADTGNEVPLADHDEWCAWRQARELQGDSNE